MGRAKTRSDRIKELRSNGLSIHEIAVALHESKEYVGRECDILDGNEVEPRVVCLSGVDSDGWRTIDPLLGTMPDSHLAKEFGLTESVIRKRRTNLGITSHKASAREDQLRAILPLLGIMSDKAIAKQMGVETSFVKYHRTKRNIKPPSPHVLEYYDEDIQKIRPMLKEVPEKVVPLLGTMRDYKIADTYGIEQSAVSERRRALGIPPYHDPKELERVEIPLNIPVLEVGAVYNATIKATQHGGAPRHERFRLESIVTKNSMHVFRSMASGHVETFTPAQMLGAVFSRE